MTVVEILQSIDATFGNYSVLLLLFTIFLSFKMILVCGLIFTGKPFRSIGSSIFYLTLVLITSMTIDITWILKSIQTLQLFAINFSIYVFWVHCSWACASIQYQSLALFLETLIQKKGTTLNKRQKIFIFISSLFASYFIFLAFKYKLYSISNQRPIIEIIAIHIHMLYLLFPLMLSTLFVVIKKMYSSRLPRILNYQLTTFLVTIITPLWLLDFLQALPIGLILTKVTNSYTFLVLSNFFLMYAVYYSARKMVGMRFLNLNTHVYESPKLEFIQEFRDILERLSCVAKEEDLGHIVQDFFRTGFQIEPHKVYFIMRTPKEEEHFYSIPDAQENTTTTLTTTDIDDLSAPQIIVDKMTRAIEAFLSDHPNEVCSYMVDAKILIYDEIAFDNFYDGSLTSTIITNFLETVHLDIFVPIYYRGSLISYIAIERDARVQGDKLFYTDVERGKILIFANYLHNIIHIMQSKNVDILLQKENRLKHELFQKQQILAQYRESIQSFIKNDQTQKSIGIIFYKNRQFTFGNTTIEDLIKIDPNVHQGHPIAHTLKRLVTHIQTTQTTYSLTSTDRNNDKIIFTGYPSIKGNSIIITVSKPEISDLLMHNQKFLLNDPSDWDFLLYLETTKHGKLINQLIPGSSKALTAFKIKLLKIAICKKPTLLFNMPQDDLQSIVQLLHNISLRETLYTIHIAQPTEGPDLSIKLFGVSPILSSPNATPSLLSQLHKVGTLFISNVHYLSQETQIQLTEFIKTGVFQAIKSDRKIHADVRIICSVDTPIEDITSNNTVYQPLLSELLQTSITLPSMNALSESELHDLATHLSQQEYASATFQNLLVLNNREKNNLIVNKPTSISDLKNRIRSLFAEKTEKNEFIEHAIIPTAKAAHIPDLTTIGTLGKNALKDKEIMDVLWHTFKNKNKIAAFLKVNRSSVNRRYKSYNDEQ